MQEISHELTELLNLISSVANQYHLKVYIVGGFIRDWLLNRQTKDIDFTVNGDVINLARTIADDIGGTSVLLDDINGVVRVVAQIADQKWQLDFASYSSSIEDDLHRRDFTIDSMAIDVSDFISNSFNLIDPFAGQTDLKQKLVRAVTPGVFKDDAVRLLRAVRIAGELGFIIEPGTEDLIKEYSDLIKFVAGEKLRSEFVRLLEIRDTGYWLRYMDNLNILTGLIPELSFMRDVGQPKEHYWNVFEHSLRTVSAVEYMIGEGEWNCGISQLLSSFLLTDEITNHLCQDISPECNRKQLLKLGGLLHDISKPQTKSIDDTGRIRFIGHTKQGAMTAADILNRLRFSNKEIKIVKNLVTYHLRPVQMANVGLPTNRAIYRYFRDAGDDSIDILVLALGDYLAARGPNINVDEWKQHCCLVEHILNVHRDQEKIMLPSRLVDGNDIMKVFSLTSGTLIGKLLTLVREAQAIGEIQTKEDAIAFIQKELNGNVK